MTTNNPTPTQQGQTLESVDAPERVKLWICCHCQTPRMIGLTVCERCHKRLHDTVEYARTTVTGPRGDDLRELHDTDCLHRTHNGRCDCSRGEIIELLAAERDLLKRLTAELELAVSQGYQPNLLDIAEAQRTAAAASSPTPAESLLQHVACSGVEFDDNRMGYVVVQIDRDIWEQLQVHKGDR